MTTAMATKKYVCHRVKTKFPGRSYEGIRYRYRGVFIECGGYFKPDHSVVWEAIDEDGIGAFAHSFDLHSCKYWIDQELDKMTEEKRNNFYTEEGLKNLSSVLGFPVKNEVE